MKKQKIIYYSDELNDDFANTNIKQKNLGKNFKYIHKNIFWNIFSFIVYYLIAFPIVWLIQKFYCRQKIINKKILRKYKNEGYFIYSNHTHAVNDSFSGPISNFPKKCYVIANPDATSLPFLKNIVQMLGAIPLPTTIKETKEFLKCIEYRIKNKNVIMIYPEAHIWPFYTKIRPFETHSFKYPIKYDAPVFCITNCYQKSKFFKKPKIISFIDGPFYTNKNLDINAACEDLRKQVYEIMCQRTAKYSTYEYIKYIKKEKEASLN